MEDVLGIYCVGATIVTPVALSRIQHYKDHLHALFGIKNVAGNEDFVTLIPPFYTNAKSANKINNRCEVSTFLNEHPLVTTLFSMQGMKIMCGESADVLHFPVEVLDVPGGAGRFRAYAEELQKRFIAEGHLSREIVPNEFNYHISMFVGKNLRDNILLSELIQKSAFGETLHFRIGFPTLFIKLKRGGWKAFPEIPIKDRGKIQEYRCT